MRPVSILQYPRRRLVAAVSLSWIAVGTIWAHATGSAVETPAPPAHPVQANLTLPLDVSRLKEGASFTVSVTEDWSALDCHLRPGALLEGRVLGILRRSKTHKTSSMQLLFERAECNGRPPTPFRLTLVAVIGPFGDAPPGGDSNLEEGPPLADAPGLTIGNNTADSREAPSGMRNATAAAAINEYTQVVRQTRKLPAQILPGQVIDVPRTSLIVGAGTEQATAITAEKKDARLEARTTLILLPASTFLAQKRPSPARTARPPETSASTREANGSAGGPLPSSRAAEPAEAADETEVCSGTCNVLGSMESRAHGASTLAAELPMGALGYAPHEKQRALSFDHETTLTYLDERHLLCTFDPHRLRVRSSDGVEPVRSIRAVLVDSMHRSVERVMDWRVRGKDAYLWRLGQGRVLVHMDHELREYDSQLRPMFSLPVEGRVAWVVSAPSNDHIAVGMLRERRSDGQAFELIGAEPEEDLEVQVFDSHLHLLSSSIRSAQTRPPVLSDAGELRADRQGVGRWKIVEYRWDRTEHPLASVHSVCRPLLSAPEHNLLFVTGCMATTGGVWYRVLRADGHPLLKGESPSDEIAQSAEGALAGAFAVRVLKAVRPLNVDQPFNRADLTREEIGIYRSSDGAKLSSVVTEDFILAQNSYALSPDGEQMAIVGRESIAFYRLNAR